MKLFSLKCFIKLVNNATHSLNLVKKVEITYEIFWTGFVNHGIAAKNIGLPENM